MNNEALSRPIRACAAAFVIRLSAVAQAKGAAHDKSVVVASPSIVQQCLNLGLLDGISVNVIPVLLGDGIPLFANLTDTPIPLTGPRIVEGNGVSHLFYRVAG